MKKYLTFTKLNLSLSRLKITNRIVVSLLVSNKPNEYLLTEKLLQKFYKNSTKIAKKNTKKIFTLYLQNR